jgi:hypothetical protein
VGTHPEGLSGAAGLASHSGLDGWIRRIAEASLNQHGVTSVNIKISSVSHRKALVLALIGIVGGLVISVVSFAATSSSATLSIAASSGLSGEFGFVLAQDTLSSTAWASDNDGDTVTVTVGGSDTNAFAVGDYILIDDDGDKNSFSGTASYHSVTAVDGLTLTVAPDIGAGFGAGTSVSEPVKYSGVHTWTPALNSATSVSAGNHFIVNLMGLTTSDSAFVELITTNPNELVKNYTYLNRTVGVHVLCQNLTADGASCAAATPYAETTAAGSFGNATDATGDSINATADILTLQNACQQFNLQGGRVYALTVEGGALFTIDTTTGAGDSLSPQDQVGITAR